jgi:hypothetical protein
MQRSAMAHSMEATPVFLVFGTRDILAVHNALEGVCNCKWYEQLLKKSTEKDARCLTPFAMHRLFLAIFKSGSN